MATQRPTHLTPAQYRSRLTDHCPMPLERWRALKGAFYSLIIAGLAVLFTVWRGNWIVFVATVVAILLITTLEVKEVEVMDAISVSLYRNRRRDQPDETDSGND